MSLLTINKLTDTVGAEVTGVDSDRLASDDLLADAVLEALEDNGVLVFPRLRLEPEAQVKTAGAVVLLDMDRHRFSKRSRLVLNRG